MTMAQARELNAQGRLTRKVMTEEGWYIPDPGRVVTPPAPLLLPPVKPRAARKSKGA
jgi:hypothetical protein